MEEKSEEKVKGYPKVVVVGDSRVGKSNLLIALTTHSYCHEHIATVHDHYNHKVVRDGKPFNMGFFDTAGRENYDRYRPLSYPDTDIVLFCFSSISRASLENLKSKWIPEVNHCVRLYNPEVGYVVVQTKCDFLEERQKRIAFERVQNDHPQILKSFLRECNEDSSEEWMPADLFDNPLKWAEYTQDEMKYDKEIEESLISDEEIEKWLETDLKFGLWKDEERAPFIRTSAVKGLNLIDDGLINAIFESFDRYESSKKRRKCQLM